MSTMKNKWRILAASCAAAASLAACHHDDDAAGTTPAPPGRQSVDFSVFAKNAFAADANSTPVSLDGVKFNFDADENPVAFDMLIMSGMY
jgi:hypothetical protein